MRNQKRNKGITILFCTLLTLLVFTKLVLIDEGDEVMEFTEIEIDNTCSNNC